MKIKKELKLNKFRMVAIPTKGEYMKRFGAINSPANYSGETTCDEGNNARKTEAMQMYDDYAKMMEKEAQEQKEQ